MINFANDRSPTGGGGDTPGGTPPEPVGERPSVGTVAPEDYPDAADKDATGSGAQSPPGLDDDMDFERRNPGG